MVLNSFQDQPDSPSELKDVHSHERIFKQVVDQAHEKTFLADQLAKKLLADLSIGPVHVLDIGCHDGSLTLKWVTQLLGQNPHPLVVTCVEPNEKALQTFQEKTGRLESHSRGSGIEFVFHSSSLEGFLSKAHPSHFDWIVASHCFYWSTDFSETIRRVLALGKNVLIAIQGCRGFFEIRSRYADLMGRRGFQLRSAETLRPVLDELGARYDEGISQSLFPVFSLEDERSRLLTSFILQSVPSEITETIHQDVHAQLSRSGEVFASESSLFWIHNE